MILIDGYNVLHGLGLLKKDAGPAGLQKARNALLGMLAGALGERAGEATVVFDAAGAPPGSADHLEYRGVRARFVQEGRQADDLLEDLIRNYSAPKQLTVVSDDNRLIKAAQQRGCTSMSCDQFQEWIQRQYRGHRRPASEPAEKAQGLSPGQTDRWLREFADLDDDPALGEGPLS